jgi:hypothetical protein
MLNSESKLHIIHEKLHYNISRKNRGHRNQVFQFPTIASLEKTHGFKKGKPTPYQRDVLGNDGQIALVDPENPLNRILKLTMRAMPVPIEWPLGFYT